MSNSFTTRACSTWSYRPKRWHYRFEPRVETTLPTRAKKKTIALNKPQASPFEPVHRVRGEQPVVPRATWTLKPRASIWIEWFGRILPFNARPHPSRTGPEVHFPINQNQLGALRVSGPLPCKRPAPKSNPKPSCVIAPTDAPLLMLVQSCSGRHWSHPPPHRAWPRVQGHRQFRFFLVLLISSGFM